MAARLAARTRRRLLALSRKMSGRVAPAPHGEEAAELIESGLFDLDYYRSVSGSPGMGLGEAVNHYLNQGFASGLNPSREFDGEFYLRHNPDVAAAKLNPFLHFVRHGAREKRRISRREAKRDADTRAILQSGLFDISFYNLQCDGDMPTPESGIRHYLDAGAEAGLNPNPYFDTAWYRATYLSSDVERENPLIDYIERGVSRLRSPSKNFDMAFYMSKYPSVVEGGQLPLAHYLQFGIFENCLPSPFKADPRVPTRVRNIFAELAPQDDEFAFRGWFDVRPVEHFPGCRQHQVPNAATLSVELGPSGGVGFPPKPYVAHFDRGVGIVGGTRLLLPDSHTVLSDEIAAYGGRDGWSIRPETYVLDAAGSLGVDIKRTRACMLASGIHLMHEYATNYFHMIAESLPRLLLAEEAGIDPDVPILIQAGLEDNLKDLVACINRRGRRIIEVPNRTLFFARELFYPADVSSIQDVYSRSRMPDETMLHNELIRKVVEIVLNNKGTERSVRRPPWRKIFVRRGRRFRGLANELEIERLLADEGFELVNTEGMSIATQVSVFRSAAMVIAPTGAAVTNILWCEPGTKVFVLMADQEASPFELWPRLGEISGCDVSIVKCRRSFIRDGKYAMHDDYVVDADVVRDIARS